VSPDAVVEGVPMYTDPVVLGIFAEMCSRLLELITLEWPLLVPVVQGVLGPLVCQLPPGCSIIEHFGTPMAARVDPFPLLLAKVFAVRAALEDATAVSSHDKETLLAAALEVRDSAFADPMSVAEVALTLQCTDDLFNAVGAAFRKALASDTHRFDLFDQLASLLLGDVRDARSWLWICGQENVIALYHHASE